MAGVNIDTLASSLLQSMPETFPFSENCSIFKIPNILRRHNPEAFVPNAFAIGPWHRGQGEHLEQAENIKLKYLQRLISQFPSPETKLKELMQEIEQIQQDVRGHYAGPIGMNDEDFVKLLVIDGCFIIEVLRKHYKIRIQCSNDEYDPIFDMSCMIQYLLHDLILLENQIPWSVLDLLFKKTMESGGPSLEQLAITFFKNIFSSTPPQFQNSYKGQNHILDLLREWLVPSSDNAEGGNAPEGGAAVGGNAPEGGAVGGNAPEGGDVSPNVALLGHSEGRDSSLGIVEEHVASFDEAQRRVASLDEAEGRVFYASSARDGAQGGDAYLDIAEGRVFSASSAGEVPQGGDAYLGIAKEGDAKEWQTMPSAQSLKEAGIVFKKGKSISGLTVRFVDGVLEIPSLLIQETTEVIFRNLISFEQCYSKCKSRITSYAVLLDSLINTEKDLKILCKEGIINNWLNPEVPTQFFNNLYHDTCLKEYRYRDLCVDVNKYCHRRWPTWRAAYIHNYFATPWAIFSQIVATIIVVLTVLQTAYSIKSYKQ